MRFQLSLLCEEEEAEGADVQRAAVVLRGEVRVIPSFHGRFTELDEFNSLEASGRHKVANLILIHADMLIILQESLLFFLSLLFFFLTLEVFHQIINKLVIYPNHVLFDPSVHRSLLLQIVYIVLNGLSCLDGWDDRRLFLYLILGGLYCRRSLLTSSVHSLLCLFY